MVVFIDVDGTINGTTTTKGEVEPACVARLARILEGATAAKAAASTAAAVASKAVVVLSTDWRHKPDLVAKLLAILGEHGITAVGATPLVGEEQGYEPWDLVRPLEIAGWLADYLSRGRGNGDGDGDGDGDGRFAVTGWLALDDRNLLTEEGGETLRGHVIQTNGLVGLSEAQVAEGVEILVKGGRWEG